MPVLHNPKHELFAQGLAAGKTADEAYSSAGYKPHRPNASRLRTNDNIANRVAELLARASQGVLITRQGVLEEIAKIAFADLGHEHVKAADKRAALKDLATMEGWIIERQEVGAPNEFEAFVSADELRAEICNRFGLAPVERSPTPRRGPNGRKPH